MLVIKPLQTTRHKQRFFRINFQCVVPCLREQFKLLSWREEKRDENIVVAEKEEDQNNWNKTWRSSNYKTKVDVHYHGCGPNHDEITR